MFNKQNFEVLKACSKEKYKGILLTQNYSVATDGSQLIKITNQKTYPREDYPVNPAGASVPVVEFTAHIETDDAVRLQKAIPKAKSSMPILNHLIVEKDEKENIVFGTTDLSSWQSISVRKRDNSFPKFEAIISNNAEKKPILSISVNPERMANIMTAAKNMGCGIVELRFTSESDSIEMKGQSSDTQQEFYGLLMPMKK